MIKNSYYDHDNGDEHDDDDDDHDHDDYNDGEQVLTFSHSEKEANFVLEEMRANVKETNSKQREILVPDPSPRKSSTSCVHESIKVFLPLILIIFI